ncbi:MAG: Uncharacterized MFS-type transporter [uncultured Actinomycetospora sp.]|uniref:Uncharacterized MFS-type transporter n=1 Tax=uncultured Actinomycetospora sp. TaxID=1135996 RepID=A0A6J4J9A5_9PSEU|nr:MAG: Uncharacterized MFS-type transporter [uncultured Actinomycetospora sp.]
MVCGVSGLLLFNVTAPNVALPEIGRALAAGFVTQQWVLSSYALVLAALLLAAGVLGDRYGHRRLFLVGLGIFTLGSLGCALAPSAAVLVAGRVVQGVGAAAMFPAGLALISAEFAGPARARAIGVWAATVAAAIALGPLLGGVLVTVAGWRAEFAVAALLALLAVLLGRRRLRGADGVPVAMDWLGTGLLSAALFTAVLVLTQGNELGWTSALVLAGAVLVLALLTGFVVVEHKVASPLIAPALMVNRTFVAATLVALIFAAAGFAPLTYIAQFLLTVTEAGPIRTGLLLAPFAVAAFAVSLLAARVAARVGLRATLAGGLLVCAAGLGLMLATGPGAGGLALLPGLTVFGVGAGLVNPTMTSAALAVVPAAAGGMAAAVNNAARQFGIAAGIAGLGALVQARLASGVSAGLTARGVPAEQAAAGAAGLAGGDPDAGAAAGVAPETFDPVGTLAYGAALDALFVAGIGIAALGAVIVLIVIRPHPHGSTPTPDPGVRRAGANPQVPPRASTPSAEGTAP